MRWIDQYTYWGLDRRRRGRFRLFGERRKQAEEGPPPSVSTALRQLQARAWDAAGDERFAEFCTQCEAVAAFAAEMGEQAVAESLQRSLDALRALQPDADRQAEIDETLRSARSLVQRAGG